MSFRRSSMPLNVQSSGRQRRRSSVQSRHSHASTGLMVFSSPTAGRRSSRLALDVDEAAMVHNITVPHLNPQSVYEVSVVAGQQDNMQQKELRVKALEAKSRHYNMGALMLGLLGLGTSIASSELLFDNQDQPSLTINILKGVTSLSTLLLVIVVIMRSFNSLKLNKTRGAYDRDETLGTSGGIQPLVCEILVCLVHAPPGVSFEIPIWNMGFEVVYTFESLCSVWQLLRLYLAVGVLNDKVGFRTAQARVIANWNNVSFNAAFTFKALMERMPLYFLLVCMLLAIFTLGYSVRVFERPVCAWYRPKPLLCDNQEGRVDFNILTNALWFIIITMTTVGYGDTFPLTNGGRAIAVIACFVGVAVIALLVTVITAMSTFRPDEMRAFNALYRNTGRKEFQDAAARMVQSVWIYSRGVKYHKLIAAGETAAHAALLMQSNRTGSTRQRKLSQREAAAAAVAAVAAEEGGGAGGTGGAPSVNTSARVVPEGSARQVSSSEGFVKKLRRMSTTRGRFTIAHGNLHLRHKHKFGKSHLLRALRQWRYQKSKFLSLTREKSEVAMVVKEVLDVRGRLNELMEWSDELQTAQSSSENHMARLEGAINRICDKLGVAGVEPAPPPTASDSMVAGSVRPSVSSSMGPSAQAGGVGGGGGSGGGASSAGRNARLAPLDHPGMRGAGGGAGAGAGAGSSRPQSASIPEDGIAEVRPLGTLQALPAHGGGGGSSAGNGAVGSGGAVGSAGEAAVVPVSAKSPPTSGKGKGLQWQWKADRRGGDASDTKLMPADGEEDMEVSALEQAGGVLDMDAGAMGSFNLARGGAGGSSSNSIGGLGAGGGIGMGDKTNSWMSSSPARLNMGSPSVVGNVSPHTEVSSSADDAMSLLPSSASPGAAATSMHLTGSGIGRVTRNS